MPESKQIKTTARVEDGTRTEFLPTKCIYCVGALDDSLEHPFNQALGGTKKSRNLYCSICNNSLGVEVDAPFAKDFEIVTTVLNVRRDRGAPPALRRTTDTGQKIRIGPGGLPSLQGPTPTMIEEQDQQKIVTITVPADRPELQQHMLAKAAKELGVRPSDFVGSNISLVTTQVGNIELRISVGGSTHERAIAKIALGFLALNIGDDVFTDPYVALRQAVHGRERRVWPQRPFRALEASVLPPSDGAQHRVIIYTTTDATWAHVEVYGTFGYAVLLSEKPDARF